LEGVVSRSYLDIPFMKIGGTENPKTKYLRPSNEDYKSNIVKE